MKRAVEEDYFSSDDDAWEQAMVRSLDRTEQLGGALGPLFHFRMDQIGRRRRWRETTDHTQYHAVLEQMRDAVPGDNIGVHLTEALYRAIRNQILPSARPHDLLHFAIQAHGFAHAFRSANLEVGEFMARGTYLDELLDTLAGKLNSNEEFTPDRGFQVEVVVVRMPTPGSGRGRNRNVGERAWEVDSKRKKSIIPIQNKDDLCCARAIVTMRAHCHRNDPGHMPWNNWKALSNGRPRQAVQARELHRLAGVAEGPCGLPELEALQRYLSPNYQIKVLSRQHPYKDLYEKSMSRGQGKVHPTVQGQGRYSVAECGEELWAEAGCQADAQFILGKIWGAQQQIQSGASRQSPPVVQDRDRFCGRITDLEDLYGRCLGSRIQTNGG